MGKSLYYHVLDRCPHTTNSIDHTHTQLHYHAQIQYHTLKTYRIRVQMSAGKGSGIFSSAIPADTVGNLENLMFPSPPTRTRAPCWPLGTVRRRMRWDSRLRTTPRGLLLLIRPWRSRHKNRREPSPGTRMSSKDTRTRATQTVCFGNRYHPGREGKIVLAIMFPHDNDRGETCGEFME